MDSRSSSRKNAAGSEQRLCRRICVARMGSTILMVLRFCGAEFLGPACHTKNLSLRLAAPVHSRLYWPARFLLDATRCGGKAKKQASAKFRTKLAAALNHEKARQTR